MQVKPPTVWGKLTDERWLHLDDTVYSKLTNTVTLSERLNHLESTIFAEAATMFGHSPLPYRNLAGQSRRTKLSINLIKEKNILLAQINSSPFPEKKKALDHLLLHIRSRIRSLRKTDKCRKRRWLLKKTRNVSKHNPYKAGKSLLDPKCFVYLKVDQTTLDHYKAFSLNDQSYNVPLCQLDGFPPQPHLIKMFKKGCFSYHDFLSLLSSRRNASAPGLNGIPYKVYKKCPKLKFRNVPSKRVKYHCNGKVWGKSIFPN